MSNPDVTCIVACYNSERYIHQALDSILAQTYRPMEIIVADDGSTDHTHSIVSDYGDLVRLVSQTTSGPAATRNLGITNARSDFLAFLDADDLWQPQKIELQMDRFKTLPELDISICHTKLIWSNDLQQEEINYRDHPRNLSVPGYTSGAMLVQRKVFVTVGLFNPRYWFGDATEWFLRAREKNLVIELLPDVLTFHRMHETNLTRRRNDASREEFLTIIKESLDRRRKEEGSKP